MRPEDNAVGYVEELRALIGHRPVILNGSVVLLMDDLGRILLQHRDDGRWGLPGGLMEPGESFEETARREVREETGLTPGPMRFLGVWSGKDYFCRAANGDEFYSVTAAFLAREWSGAPAAAAGESLGFAWTEPDALPENTVGSHRRIIAESTAGKGE